MKNQVMFGLLALAMLASVSFAYSAENDTVETLASNSSAYPSDYDNFVMTGGCLRYIGPEVFYPYFVSPMAHPDEYREVEFSQIHYNLAAPIGGECPRENGVPICQ